jgi:hypothetical protein
MLNPFFQQGSRSEQSLVQDIINEQLRMYGVEVHYLPRKYATEKTIIREVVQSVFDDAYPIEAYVDNFEGYGDNVNILSKFGIQATNEITLIISKERFEDYISPLMKNEDNIKLSTRPKEGDLIYFPLGDRLFEIKFVEHEKPFYQLQKNYVYELKCELFRYEDEVIDTGVDEIDDTLIGDEYDGTTDDGLSTILGPTQTFTMVGTGATAAASAGIITSGGIRLISINNRGGGYIGAPRVAISSAPSGGLTGIASVSMISGISVCTDNVNAAAESIQRVDIVNPGYGYTQAPNVQFISATGSGAAVTAFIGDNIVGVVTITSGGSGFTTTPTITFTNEIFLPGVTTVAAAATAVVSAAGTLTAIRLTNAGLGYSVAPTISIEAPSLSSTGDYAFNEIVTGQTSGATGRVRVWNSATNELKLGSIEGSFREGERVTGGTSGADRVLRVINLDPIDDEYADNFNIESEADSIIDFSERNPFGMP